jgi:hypothetical protein
MHAMRLAFPATKGIHRFHRFRRFFG